MTKEKVLHFKCKSKSFDAKGSSSLDLGEMLNFQKLLGKQIDEVLIQQSKASASKESAALELCVQLPSLVLIPRKQTRQCCRR